MATWTDILTFKEGDETDQTAVLGATVPLGQDDRVLRVQRHVVRLSFQHDDLRQIAVQVGQILQHASVAFKHLV